ncbi:MAG TPA: hypothetical protein ENK14_10180 [Caldithrix sp.]|nr:hypothetical protein [Caldithrix sp.]
MPVKSGSSCGVVISNQLPAAGNQQQWQCAVIVAVAADSKQRFIANQYPIISNQQPMTNDSVAK